VLERLTELFAARGTPTYIRSDNGSEFTAKAVREWLGRLGDELLNGEIFYTLTKARVLIERWRQEYNTFRPHSSLGHRAPAPEAIPWPPTASASLQPEDAFGLT
jgi:transposase InsO family protein